MWRKAELNPNKGLFLLRNGLYIKPEDIGSKLRNKVVGYVLDTSGKYSDKNIIIPINSSDISMEFIKFKNIKGLTNLEYYDESINPYKDTNGKYNTKCISDYILLYNRKIIDESPALDYCINFSPGYKDGEWYLPSMGELKLFYDNRGNFSSDCNTAGIFTNMNSDYSCRFWSSTLSSNVSAWSLFFCNFTPSVYYCGYNNFYVVPFLAF